MAKRRKKKGENKFIRLILIIITVIGGFYLSEIDGTYSLNNTQETFSDVSSDLVVSYLDVGQADAILVQNNGEAMLIDAGNNEDGEILVEYFRKNGVSSFKYLVGTHPHEDHIGGLDDIINNFSIDTIYLPDVITTTKTFTEVLDAIENKNKTYEIPKIGEEFYLGEARGVVIYTGNDDNDLNNSSIVLRLSFGNTSFLFTGDMEENLEKKILDKDIQADVLKVGHHGSEFSTMDTFLKRVNPKYAIISVGKKNSYGHPHKIILDKLNKNNVETHRTDEEGTIVVTSDGKNIMITSKQTDTNGG